MSSLQEITNLLQMRKEVCDLRDTPKTDVLERCIKQRLAKVDKTYIHELSRAVAYLTPRVSVSRIIK